MLQQIMQQVDKSFSQFHAKVGLLQHTLEVKSFLKFNKTDFLHISETHFTQKHHFLIDGFKF